MRIVECSFKFMNLRINIEKQQQEILNLQATSIYGLYNLVDAHFILGPIFCHLFSYFFTQKEEVNSLQRRKKKRAEDGYF